MCASYSNFRPNDLSETVDAWEMILSDYSYKDVSVALKAYILSDVSGFAPSIGQLVSKIGMIQNKKELNEMEAWALVSNALRNGTYGAAEEFEKLPEIVQKAVGSPENLRNWAQTDVGSVENVIQSNFIKTYRAEMSRKTSISILPDRLQKLMDNSGGSSIKMLD